MPAPVAPLLTPPAPDRALSIASLPRQAPAAAEFSSLLSEAIDRVNQSNRAAANGIDRYLSGENEEVHDVVLNIQRNELQFELFLQMRNKAVQAYQEVMRMQM